MKTNTPETPELVYVGIKGSVVALNRATGEQVWATRLKGADFVNLIVQNDVLLASCRGEVFCLDPTTGNALWHNPLKGFGVGLATIATQQGTATGDAALLAECLNRDEAAAAGAAVAVVVAAG